MVLWKIFPVSVSLKRPYIFALMSELLSAITWPVSVTAAARLMVSMEKRVALSTSRERVT
ncbi:hypothetical protein D3C72_2520970 [compost metagenome]